MLLHHLLHSISGTDGVVNKAIGVRNQRVGCTKGKALDFGVRVKEGVKRFHKSLENFAM